MKKIQLTAIMLVFCVISYAQEDELEVRRSTKIDFNDIKNEVLAQNSIFNFDKLFKRYQANDTTLDVVDYKHLYYGYTFTHKYSPSRRNEVDEKKVNKILAKPSQTYSDYKNILKMKF